MSENEATPEADGLGAIPAQTTATESPTVAVARERLVEAIGREAVFLADQRAGQASEGLETLARAFALVASGSAPAGIRATYSGETPHGRVLSIQSANGTYSEEDRSAMQIEVDQLTDERTSR
ncbi:hypothetical protein [Streptomyces sp. NBC_00442]|uniref:hypothetical protein n=1 Tax=Streptomyces sp. NBC_00442 TaxID=2903651 RepID=UPI002E20BD26